MTDTKTSPLHDVIAKAPTPEVVARLDRWLRLNPDAWVRLYHGTDARFPVQTEGLLPTSQRRRNSLQSRSGYVSFSLFPEHAELFAQLAYPQRTVTVYGADLRVGELVPDLDQLRNQRQWAERDVKSTLAHSLAYGHGAQVKGAVAGARLFSVKICIPRRSASIGPSPTGAVNVAPSQAIRPRIV